MCTYCLVSRVLLLLRSIYLALLCLENLHLANWFQIPEVYHVILPLLESTILPLLESKTIFFLYITFVALYIYIFLSIIVTFNIRLYISVFFYPNLDAFISATIYPSKSKALAVFEYVSGLHLYCETMFVSQ